MTSKYQPLQPTSRWGTAAAITGLGCWDFEDKASSGTPDAADALVRLEPA